MWKSICARPKPESCWCFETTTQTSEWLASTSVKERFHKHFRLKRLALWCMSRESLGVPQLGCGTGRTSWYCRPLRQAVSPSRNGSNTSPIWVSRNQSPDLVFRKGVHTHRHDYHFKPFTQTWNRPERDAGGLAGFGSPVIEPIWICCEAETQRLSLVFPGQNHPPRWPLHDLTGDGQTDCPQCI